MDHNQVLDIFGTFSFAVAGAFAAMSKRLDPFGVLILAFVTAIGGGTIRDVLLGATPVAWLSNFQTTFVIIVAAGISLFFANQLKKFGRMLFLFDALGLGFFTIVGIQKGIDYHLSVGVCIALGTISGCFGGVLRDVLLNNVPLIFQKEIYASACIVAGLLYFILLRLEVPDTVASIGSIISLVLVRWLAVVYKWSLPRFYR